jgi:predicted heme/steroid binding protein
MAFAGEGDQKPVVATAPVAAVQKAAPDTLLRLTLAELARYNGQNGMPAFVAVDDTVYDVTKVKAWANGKHHGNKAGTDCSKAILKSPHRKSVLRKLKKVGIIVAESKPADAGAAPTAKPAAPVAPVK